MRKHLLGTTALVAGGLAAGAGVSPAQAADPISLSLGGYYQAYFVGRAQEETNFGQQGHETDVYQEGEVHFVGETTLDNGIRVGVNIQLEAEQSGDQIDEHYVYFAGSFGRLVIGAENSAAYLMHYNAPQGSVGLGVNSPNHTLFLVPSQNQALTTTFVNNTSDANKLTYFTPRFAPGFQFGFSYTPDDNDFGGRNGQANRATLKDTPGGLEHGHSFGVNFVRTVGGIDIAWSGGFEGGFLEERDEAVANEMDGYQWAASTGFNFGFGGWTVGGSAAYYDDNDPTSAANRRGGRDAVAGDVGVTYGIGPWLVGLVGMYGITREANCTTTPGNAGGAGQQRGCQAADLLNGNDERAIIELGATYTLGPGVRLSGAAQVATFEGDNDNQPPAAGTNNNEETEGVAFALGTALSF